MKLFYNSVLNNLGNLPQETRAPLKRGVSGNYQTVKKIKYLAHKFKGHPKVRRLAEEIINLYKTDSQNFVDEAYAIGDWVKNSFPYAKDPQGIESVKSPLTMIDQLERGHIIGKDLIRGDCDDMALLIATLLLSIRHQPYLCIVRFPQFKAGYQHIYVCAYERNGRGKRKRLILDAIVKDRHTGYEVNYSQKKEIKV